MQPPSAADMASLQDFQGRSALVTGAASGIGAACATALAARGASKLTLIDLDEAGMAALNLGNCAVERVIGSVSDEALWDTLQPKLDGLDHAIVNAGIGAGGGIKDLDFATWRKVMDVNLDGAFLTLRAGMRAMADKGGSAVVVASSTGVKAVPTTGAYGVSKAAVAHMARMAALEGAPNNIRVNAIAPGGVDTAIWESSPEFNEAVEKHGREATIKAMAGTTPLARFASSAEIADNILYMLSGAGANLTGHVLVSDGGYTL